MNASAAECVILLHGLARTAASMAKLAKVLDYNGYKAINIDYPSTKYEIKQLAQQAVTEGLKQCQGAQSVSFVTHSMGGILLRQYLQDHPIAHLKHVVMLGPPNHGSEVVDRLANFPGFKLINGPAGQQLGTEPTSVPNQLGDVDFSLGVIAGTKTINFILATLLPKPNDGKVSVESTKLGGMVDHIVMPVTHSFMMRNNDVIEQILYFLKNGLFKRCS